jgi:formyltetrahydrofolate deformylase
MTPETLRLLIYCPDRRGIIAAVTGFIAAHNGNILELDQHTDPQHAEFFMRLEVELDGFSLGRRTFEPAWTPLAHQYEMRWHAHWGDYLKRMAILVSKEGHCLNDLLFRHRTGELNVEIPLVVGNHDVLGDDVRTLGVPFYHVPVSRDDKAQAEAQLFELMRENNVDFIVLARYMQILSPAFVAEFPERIINVHHSFLPAFAGSRPYHQAYERGVKLIGATSHYVTDQLDEGPIIAQVTHPVDHRDTVDDLVRAGRDLERIVLSTAVRLHVEDKILVSKNKTVVFD